MDWNSNNLQASDNFLKTVKLNYTPWFTMREDVNIILPKYDFTKNVGKVIWKCHSNNSFSNSYSYTNLRIHFWIIRMNDGNYCLIKEVFWMAKKRIQLVKDGSCKSEFNSGGDFHCFAPQCHIFIARTFADLFRMSMTINDRQLYNKIMLRAKLCQKALIAFFKRSDKAALRVFASRLELVGYIYKDLMLDSL